MRRLKLLLGVFLAVLIVACGGGGDPGTNSTSSTIPLFTTAPDTLTLAPGASQEFTIGGGKAPYSAASDNSAIAIVWVNGNLLDVGGVAAGTAGVTIRDSAGASVKVALTVSGSSAKDLYTTAPSGITVAIGSAWAQTYGIGGGSAPYTVTSGNTLVATVAMAGNNYIVTGVSAGTTNILIRDSAGATMNVSVTTVSPGLTTTAPPSVTIAIGSTQTYAVRGGTGPYTATSSNASVAFASLVGDSLTVTGITAGSANVFISDSQGATVNVAVTVPAASTVALFTTAPPTGVTIAIGSTQTYGVGGGTGPYTATSGNTSVAVVSLVDNSLTVTGITAGAANVVIRDSQGATVPVAVTVPAASTVALSTTAPPTGVTIAIGSTQTYAVRGGTGPYTATSSNASVAFASLVGNSLTVTGITAGSANVFISDSQGATVNVAVTVPAASTVALSTTAPPTGVTIAIGSTQTYAVRGGTGPYTATSSNASVAFASLVGNSLTVTGITAGSANVFISDSQGATVNVAVTVPAATTVALFTTALPNVTIAIGSTQTYGVGGGTGPYTVTSGNTSVAVVSLVGNNLTVTGLSAGSTSIVVRDAVGATVPVAVTVGLKPLSITPNSATGIIDDILVATIVGGAPPYRASVGNILVATASIVGSDQLTIQLKQTGQTVITVLDANNQSAPYSVTSNAATPGIRLSPSVLTVSEKDNQAITLSVYGATGSISVFSSDIALLRAAVVGSKVSVTTGSNGTRCVAANTPVVITVVDSTGASALATVTIADNGTCP
jgi:ribosomal protein L11